MKRTLKILTSTLTAGLLVWGLAQALAEEPRVTKRFPPYPDVWGIELPYPRPGDRNAISGLFLMADGEITIITKRRTIESRRSDGTCCEFSFEYGRIELFQRLSTSVTVKEADAFADQNRARRTSNLPRRIALTNGRLITARIRDHNCFSYGKNGIEIQSATGEVLRQVHLYYVGDDTVHFHQKPECESAGGASFVRMRVREIVPNLIPLEDSTFLVVDSEGNVVIRFDENLKTAFPLNGRVFVLERSEFERLYATVTQAAVLNQVLHDLLLRHLLQRRTDWKESK